MTALKLLDVHVSFGGVKALDGLTVEVAHGHIHGLIGPNGAGKTTALNVLTGLVRPQSGGILLDGSPFVPHPRQLVGSGLSRVFQTPAIFHELTALENVIVGGHSLTRAGLLRSAFRPAGTIGEERALRVRARELLARVGFAFALDVRASKLPYGAHRKMELARALMTNPKILLLDEPTAGLSAQEVQAFADLLRSLRAETNPPLTVLVVEHNVPFVFGVCDVVTAMDSGQRIASGSPSDVRRDPAVVKSYLGGGAVETSRPIVGFKTTSAKPAPVGATPGPITGGQESPPVLELSEVTSGYDHTTILRGASLRVRSKELVAVLGRNGAGKSTLLNTIVGMPKPWTGAIHWRGQRVDRLPTDRVVRSGIGLVPQGLGLIERQSVDDNFELSTFGLKISNHEYRARVEEMFTWFPRLAERRRQLAGNLSGGERRMLAIAKVLMRRPLLLMLDEPSTGLAPAIVDELQHIVSRLNGQGLPVLVAEQNVSWILPLTNRTYLLDAGTITEPSEPFALSDLGIVADSYLGQNRPRGVMSS